MVEVEAVADVSQETERGDVHPQFCGTSAHEKKQQQESREENINGSELQSCAHYSSPGEDSEGLTSDGGNDCASHEQQAQSSGLSASDGSTKSDRQQTSQ